MAYFDSHSHKMLKNLFASCKKKTNQLSGVAKIPVDYVPALVMETNVRAVSPYTQNMFLLWCELPIWFPPSPLDMENNFPNW